MGTNGTAPKPQRSTTASKLFDLFRDREVFDVKGPDDAVVMQVTFQALDWQQNNRAARALDEARFRVRAEFAKTGVLENWRKQVEEADKEQSINILIAYEKPTAESVADLAPNAVNEDGSESDKKEGDAVKQWEDKRRKDLAEMELDEIHELLVQRQENLYIQARALDDYMNEALSMMIVDPATGDPVFSADPEAENFIGELMPELRQQLITFRQQFIEKRSEKAIRKGAEDKDFLSSGESPSPDTATPGETTETPRRSRRTPSTSTTAAAG